MHRSLPTLLTTAVVVLPVGLSACTGASVPAAAPTSVVHTQPAPTRTPVPKKKNSARPTATTTLHTVTIVGPSVDMDWGPVQVTIVVKGKKLVGVTATAPMERARSNYINSQAIPWLRQETLQAQSANIDLIGGATLTSEAYTQSLQGALDQAHLSTAHS